MPINGTERSPCVGCEWEHTNKISGHCADCEKPMAYADDAYGVPFQARLGVLKPRRDLSGVLNQSAGQPCRTENCPNLASPNSIKGYCGACRRDVERGHSNRFGRGAPRSSVSLEQAVELLIMNRAGLPRRRIAERLGLSIHVVAYFIQNDYGEYARLKKDAEARIFETGRDGEHLRRVELYV